MRTLRGTAIEPGKQVDNVYQGRIGKCTGAGCPECHLSRYAARSFSTLHRHDNSGRTLHSSLRAQGSSYELGIGEEGGSTPGKAIGEGQSSI